MQQKEQISLTRGNSRYKWLAFIFLIAIGLRFTLALINNEANDNHVDVVNLIISKHELPEKKDCWSCYQPKLYYVFCAGVIKCLGIENFYPRIKTMNVINVFLSLFILLICWKFIEGQKFSDSKKLLVFSFFAFNPCLAGINVQSTNDTAAIFFGTLAIYSATRFFTKASTGWFAALALSLICGMLSKASVGVLFGVTGITFAIKILYDSTSWGRRQTIKYLVILLVMAITTVPYLGGYYVNYEKYHSLTISTWDKDPPAHFFEKTWVMRAGLRSIADGFLTFRYLDMIIQPYINNDCTGYPLHRTSLWSQLYGRTIFMHFDQWPVSWQTRAPFIVNIGRALIILGIVPLLLFLTGILLHLRRLILKLYKGDKAWMANPLNYFYLFATLAFLLSSVFYTYSYRDFSSMKSIYIFAGLLAYIKMFCDGYALIEKRKMVKIADGILGLIIILSLADIGFLIYQLH